MIARLCDYQITDCFLTEDATDNVDGEGVPGGAGEGAPGEGAASGEDDEPDDEGDQDEHHEDDGWQHLPEQPSLSLEVSITFSILLYTRFLSSKLVSIFQ